jgi:hypothetical protein
MKSMIVVPAVDSEAYLEYGRKLAEKYGVPFCPRNGKTIHQLQSILDSALLVAHSQGCYYVNGLFKLRYHMGLAPLRLKQIRNGKTDYLLEALHLQGSEKVIDATFGLGADALVMASILQSATGHIIGLESAEPIFCVATEGVLYFRDQTGQITEESRKKIQLLHRDYQTYLKEQADQSVDIVFFDPMFQRPVKGSENLGEIRRFANTEPLLETSIQEAIRISRKRVVIKERRDSNLWPTWPIHRKFWGKYSNIAYGVIDCER